MTTTDLLVRLREADITVTVEGDQLRVEAPTGAMTAALREDIARHKAALLTTLRAAGTDTGGATRPPVLKVPRSGPLRASLAQQRLWFLERLQPGRATFNVPMTWRLRGPLRRDALVDALGVIVARHEALRTVFEDRAGEPFQVIREAAPVSLVVSDLRALDGLARRERALSEALAADATRPFDLARGPLFRARLWVLGADDHVLQMVAHHTVADGWSIGVIVREISAAYASVVRGEAAALTEPALQYVDAAASERVWLDGEGWQPLLRFWTDRLAGAPDRLTLPTDRPRPAELSLKGATARRVVAPALHARLTAFARAHQVSEFVVMLAAFIALLHRWSHERDVVIGTPVANRTRTELEPLVGFFVNMVALRADCGGNPPFRDLLSQVRRGVLDALAHQELPFDRLVEQISPKRSASISPVFQVIFAPLDEREGPSLPDVTAETLPITTATAKYDLTMFSIQTPQGLDVGLEYATDLFDEATAGRILDQYVRLLDDALERPDAPVGALAILTAAERTQLLVDFNDAGRHPVHRPAPFDADATLSEIFEGQAQRTPDAVAVTCDGQSWTYRELNEHANRIASRLRERGVGPNVLVGVCLERSNAMIAALLGVIKAGGAYLPIDLTYPPDRLAFMLEDAEAALLIAEAATLARVPGGTQGTVVTIEEWLTGFAPAEALADAPSPAKADDLAYVIYTSGTTGRPKGSQVTHRNVTSLFIGTDRLYAFGDTDVWTMFHSVAFDFSVWEIWGALLFGGRLVVVPFVVSRSPEAFYDLLSRERVTVLNQTPSAFRLVQAEQSSGEKPLALRYIIFGGESLDIESLRPWFERHGDRRPQLVNMYGITETTVFVTYRPLAMHDTSAGRVIGGPIPLWQVYLLDEYRNPVPVGVVGEIYVGGAGVTRGYLNRPELTAERFVTDPFDPSGRALLYRSGDLARYLPDGDIEFLGRRDHQVKMRGFRIELGEIEAVLGRHDTVHDCRVLARGTGDDTRLVAYVVLRSGATPSVDAWRKHLRAALPDYMVPAAFVPLGAIPLTVSGKLDLGALPEPDVAAIQVGASRAAAESSTEVRLAAIWRDLLGLRDIGRNHDFFEIGGHSLMAMRLLHRIHAEFGVALTPGALFEVPVLRDLAAHIDAQAAGASAVATPALPQILLQLEAGGSGTPFFWVHGVAGEVYSFMEVSKHLGRSRPVYGFAADWSRFAKGQADSLEKVAAIYVHHMRKVQPLGPYHLGAYCAGCPLMIEMARVLIAAGQPVGQMAAIDYDLRLPGPPPTTLQAVAAFSANLPRWVQDDAIPSGARDLWGRVMSGLRRRLRRGRGPGDPNRPAVVDIRDRLGMWRFPDYSVGMLELHHRLIGDHVMTPIGAKVTLILARALPVLGPWPRGPHANWTRLAAGGLVVHDIKGSHSTMMSGPFAAGLAAILDKEIAAIERDQPAPQAPSTVRSSAS